MDRPTLLLSVDFEDWHQLVRRRIGLDGWEKPGGALPRQTERLLALLEQLGVRATFFILGLAARSHPDLVERIAAAGHEIGCHGDDHRLVHSQTAPEFAADLQTARSTIEQLTGRQPIGYRAPAFSITSQTPWAYNVLIDEGFAYDASEKTRPLRRDKPVNAGPPGPHARDLANGTLWEFPVAAWGDGPRRIPLGGASYWALMPTAVVLRGLEHAGQYAGLYLHPYELDPKPLRLGATSSCTNKQRAQGVLRTAQRNLARRRAPSVLEAIAERHRLIPYGDAFAELSRPS